MNWQHFLLLLPWWTILVVGGNLKSTRHSTAHCELDADCKLGEFCDRLCIWDHPQSRFVGCQTVCVSSEQRKAVSRNFVDKLREAIMHGGLNASAQRAVDQHQKKAVDSVVEDTLSLDRRDKIVVAAEISDEWALGRDSPNAYGQSEIESTTFTPGINPSPPGIRPADHGGYGNPVATEKPIGYSGQQPEPPAKTDYVVTMEHVEVPKQPSAGYGTIVEKPTIYGKIEEKPKEYGNPEPAQMTSGYSGTIVESTLPPESPYPRETTKPEYGAEEPKKGPYEPQIEPETITVPPEDNYNKPSPTSMEPYGNKPEVAVPPRTEAYGGSQPESENQERYGKQSEITVADKYGGAQPEKPESDKYQPDQSEAPEAIDNYGAPRPISSGPPSISPPLPVEAYGKPQPPKYGEPEVPEKAPITEAPYAKDTSSPTAYPFSTENLVDLHPKPSDSYGGATEKAPYEQPPSASPPQNYEPKEPVANYAPSPATEPPYGGVTTVGYGNTVTTVGGGYEQSMVPPTPASGYGMQGPTKPIATGSNYGSETAVVLGPETMNSYGVGGPVDNRISPYDETDQGEHDGTNGDEANIVTFNKNCPAPPNCHKFCGIYLDENGCQGCQCLWITRNCTRDMDCAGFPNQICDLGRCICRVGFRQNMMMSGKCEVDPDLTPGQSTPEGTVPQNGAGSTSGSGEDNAAVGYQSDGGSEKQTGYDSEQEVDTVPPAPPSDIELLRGGFGRAPPASDEEEDENRQPELIAAGSKSLPVSAFHTNGPPIVFSIDGEPPLAAGFAVTNNELDRTEPESALSLMTHDRFVIAPRLAHLQKVPSGYAHTPRHRIARQALQKPLRMERLEWPGADGSGDEHPVARFQRLSSWQQQHNR